MLNNLMNQPEHNGTMKKQENRWPNDVRLKMIERSELYDNPKVYQYGYYDGYQKAFEPAPSPEAKEGNAWVSVKERLPEPCTYESRYNNLLYLYSDRGHYGYEALGYYGSDSIDPDKIGFQIISEESNNLLRHNIKSITHWFKLPEQP